MSLDFLGIGAQKSGTTWLYEQLRQHPELAFPAKEVHFWDQFSAPASTEAVASYLQLFEVAEKQNGEITPAYAFLTKQMIQQIFQTAPKAKLFYIIRDPVARAWSGALMALGRAEMTIDEASDTWFIDHFKSRGSMARGDYAACLDTWLSVYPKEQLLLLRYDEIKTNPELVLEKLCAHLGVDPAPLTSNPNLKERVFKGPGHTIRPALKDYLAELYKEPKQRLKTRYGVTF